MKSALLIFVAVLALFGAVTANAEPSVGYKHPHSGIALPATLDALSLRETKEAQAPALDVIVNYGPADGSESLTVYFYRLVAGSTAVWFDRARSSIEHRSDLYGKVTPTDTPVAFTTPGSANASGFVIAYTPERGYRGTALALFSTGDWLVKIRYSSRSLDAATLRQHIDTLLGEIDWPEKMAAQRAAIEVLPCANTLAFKGTAKDRKTDATAAMAAALVAAAAAGLEPEGNDTTPTESEPPALWCRDASPLDGSGIYRANGAASAYLIALGDAGRAVSVDPDLIALVDPSTKPGWNVSLILLDRTTVYVAQDRLPTPKRALAVAEQSAALASVTTFGKDRSITITSNALK